MFLTPTTVTTMNIIPNSADSASATVVPSTIIIFLPGVTAQHQEDVSNSFELAARAATKQVSGINYTRWFRVFQTVLRNIHWFTLQAESERTIRDPVLDIIPVDDSERHLASEALRALQNPEHEDALRLFCDQHPTSRAAREDIRQLFFGGGGRYTRPAKFQLALCSEVDGDVSVSSFFLRLHNRGPAGATIGFHKYGLNTRLFERLRSGLKKKLEDSGESKQVRIEY
ncbi:32 kDa-cell wall symbiosis regulated acidic polypeptide precursor [Pisolithus microcarpus]|nr:32 kDa-cell wall symbiosis regulated acidic polypeptide precursor [Pisolithus microcarpus]